MIEQFQELYPNLSNIDIAYRATPNDKHETQFVIDTVQNVWMQNVDETLIYKGNFEKTEDSIEFLDQRYWNDLVRIYDEEALREATGLVVDDKCNFYNSLDKDLNNDEIKNRYDNDFKYSNYLDSTYNIYR